MYFRTLLSLLFIGGILVGCNLNNSNSTPNTNPNKNIGVEQSSYEENYNLTNQEIASHLATLAIEVPDVNDAAAIVAGPYAVVGIDIDEATERQRVGTIKYSVNEALQHDPYGKTAVVVADADMPERLREMNDKIRQGYPISGVVDELAEIVGRYMPSFPVPENRPEERDENEEKTPAEDKQKLDQIQREQSNR
ncbi:YhcN/YlaJ family sporulation lipoprotein [Pseudogracilibacillus sp. SE30717A]|uniref:YhcN/YlaJ family sporulation lipoprotein n=1 Tax=Pseudogracilibacillus sp. SE30717A TaxID=3098293 RepID=UPI00300E5114